MGRTIIVDVGRPSSGGAGGCYRLREQLFDGLERLLGDVAGQRVLDVGCGDGTLARRLAKAGATVVGIDAAPAAVAHARAAERGNPRFAVADGLWFRAKRPFHVITVAFVINELGPRALKRLFSNLAQNLVSGGRLVILLPHPAFEDLERTPLITRQGIARCDYLRDGLRYEVSFRIGPGHRVTRSERHHSLGCIVSALTSAGLLVSGIEELSYGTRPAARAQTVPSYLVLDSVLRGWRRSHGRGHRTASSR